MALSNSQLTFKNNSADEYKSFSRDDFRQRSMAPYQNVSGEQVSFQEFRDAIGGGNNSLNDYRSFAHDTLHNITGVVDSVLPFGRNNSDNLSMFHSFDEGRRETPLSGNFGGSAANYKMVLQWLCSNCSIAMPLSSRPLAVA